MFSFCVNRFDNLKPDWQLYLSFQCLWYYYHSVHNPGMWEQVCSKRLSRILRRIRISKFFENFALRTLNRNDYFALRMFYWEKSQCVWFLDVQISIFNEKKIYMKYSFDQKRKAGEAILTCSPSESQQPLADEATSLN